MSKRRRNPRRAAGLGKWGEVLALGLLRLKGFRLEARNWRCRLGELDLVMRKGGVLVFVEVKTRASKAAGSAELAVHPEKQRRLARLAQVYLARRLEKTVPCRFDVVAVDFSRILPRLRHYPGAFLINS